ncbi:hypothetical protein LEP1GSC060_2335 [Leptospira weilii serovar Ranarum str. ICFT]|uniref:Uncharacterized protein n=1 Tax=Leptospira weilii serovar Ranarum str. ICFT TaxID=1218598 RepID=N1WGK3_9LEPT|nr:hypothetical protein LEP1GSC060_2335 [Leptospira weilii serovar Ranarum str. ICFT]
MPLAVLRLYDKPAVISIRLSDRKVTNPFLEQTQFRKL